MINKVYFLINDFRELDPLYYFIYYQFEYLPLIYLPLFSGMKWHAEIRLKDVTGHLARNSVSEF